MEFCGENGVRRRLSYNYSRTPLLRPPLGLAICGRNRGVAVIQALEHVAMHMCICGKIHMYNIT